MRPRASTRRTIYGGYEVGCRDVMRAAPPGAGTTSPCSPPTSATGAWPTRRMNALPIPRAPRLAAVVSFAEDGHRLVDPPLHKRWRMERESQRALTEAIDDSRPDVAAVWQIGALSLGLLTTLASEASRSSTPCSTTGPPTPPSSTRGRAISGASRPGRLAHSVASPVLPTRAARPRALGDVLLHQRGCTRRRADVYGAWPLVDTSDRLQRHRRPSLHHPAWRCRSHLGCVAGAAALRRSLTTPGRGSRRWSEPCRTSPEATLEVQGTGDRRRTGAARRRRRRARGRRPGAVRAVDRGQLVERYRAADAVVFPSEWEEPFGLVPLEAMAVRHARRRHRCRRFGRVPARRRQLRAVPRRATRPSLATAVQRRGRRRRACGPGSSPPGSTTAAPSTSSASPTASRPGSPAPQPASAPGGRRAAASRRWRATDVRRLTSGSASCRGTPPPCSTAAWPPCPAALGDLRPRWSSSTTPRTDDSADGRGAPRGRRGRRTTRNEGYARAMNQALAGTDGRRC